MAIALTQYKYSIQNDFPNRRVAPDRLTLEIQQSVIVTALDHIDTIGDVCEIWFKDVLSAGDKIILDGVFATHSGDPLPQNVASPVQLYSNGSPVPINNDGAPVQVPLPRIGNELIEITHNFCDRTTWFTQSVRVVDEALVDSNIGLSWTSARPNWIDMTHGKVFDEDSIVKDVPHGYAIVVKVDGVTMTQRAPFADAGGDYTVDYKLGVVTFFSTQLGKVVTASYSYENGSEWRLVPSPGKRIDIEMAEVQFSKDAILNDNIIFEVWVYNPADLPNKFPYDSTVYKRFINYVDEALGSYPIIPPIGGAKRGTSNELFGFPFRYGTLKRLQSSVGAELRIRLVDNQVFGGEHATATFYCTVENDP